MTPRRRWSLIALGAIATGIAVGSGSRDHQVPDGMAVPGSVPAIAAHRDAAAALELPARRSLSQPHGNLFEPRFRPPPASPPAPPQVDTPQPPPNPYRFVGSVESGGSRRLLLARGDRTFEVKEGETLDPEFRVLAIDPHAVTLLYKPLNAPVTVALTFQEPPSSAAAAPAAAATGSPTAIPTPLGPQAPAALPFPPGSPLNPTGVFRDDVQRPR